MEAKQAGRIAQRRVTWEETPCPLCAADAEQHWLTVQPAGEPDSYRLVRCGQCGLGYLNPRPDVASIGQFYSDEYEWYHPPAKQPSWWRSQQAALRRRVMSHCYGTPPRLTRWQDKLLATLAAPWMKPTPDSMNGLPYHGEGKLLDFGCGSGWYAHKMQELGWNVTGMDFNAEAARQVQDRFGIPVHVGTLPHPDVPPETFDVITMGAVLEHVHTPHEVVAAAVQALKPGGYLVAAVPNIASWGFRQFGADWWGLQIPHHLLHFTPATLRKLMELHGLEVREVRLIGQAGWMRRSLATLRENAGRRTLRTELGKLRIVSSMLNRWTVWTQAADSLQVIAYRPAVTKRRRAAA